MAGTPGNRTQLPINNWDNGFEDRSGHQPRNHSQLVYFGRLRTLYSRPNFIFTRSPSFSASSKL